MCLLKAQSKYIHKRVYQTLEFQQDSKSYEFTWFQYVRLFCCFLVPFLITLYLFLYFTHTLCAYFHDFWDFWHWWDYRYLLDITPCKEGKQNITRARTHAHTLARTRTPKKRDIRIAFLHIVFEQTERETDREREWENKKKSEWIWVIQMAFH